MTYDVVTPIEQTLTGHEKKTRWHKIGRAWSETEDKICVVLDSIPFRSEYVYLIKADVQKKITKQPLTPVRTTGKVEP